MRIGLIGAGSIGLAEGRRFEPGTPAYGAVPDAAGLRAALAGA
jgi:hypothetical protein